MQPAWSPDGDTIAFVSGDDTSTQIYLIDSDGGDLRPLTAAPGYNEGPAWSPDGQWIAFWSDRSGDREIYTVGIDGTGLMNLTNDSASDENPAWSRP